MKLRLAAIITILLFIYAVLWSAIAHGQEGRHGVGHTAHHEEYQHWLTPSGGSCCNDKDCRPTRAWQDDSGQWHAQLDGRWIIVPADKVLARTAKDGNSHICANEYGTIFCFVGGVPKS